ncbi:ricin-type beta-trefoil lectin domain protein [Streptomyces caniscabiei]|uniref:ricin-type beta-trefoil lectin domain protein n=1 Tax=Streptomyces caniscabiei TaxID=2746961 RepID=UPI0018732BD1|nr:ricin-type beta-trefoil lectin domain protein [Streptomyces caniscabiei]MBE4758885.1 ricin-type beta-trefoil lectin domain protein [Streptomyces caniscabiei]MBE4770014.1 ricin-type beta-trefoil lectin domain protein [Streptomyces caniscabiei]MBE4785159.1 ricin-type beta-trefoil lectin domain protein [Streptomyces caniscabiei]MBE4797736.1 ricin-type beta-trefoil lectin domain protein [Streptomyces caniscabiei]
MARARDERPGGDNGHEDHHRDTGAPSARPDDGSEHRHANASDSRLTALLRSDSPTAYTALRELRERHHPSVLAYARLCAASESAARELATQAFTVATKETARGVEATVPWRHRLLLLTARVAGGWATGGGATGLAPALRVVLDTAGPGGRVPPLLAAFELLPPRPQGLIWYGIVEDEPDDRTAVLLGLTPDDVTYKRESALHALRQACLRVRLAASDDPRCQDFRRLIEESVRPDTPRHSTDLRAHMEHCPHCTGAYEELRALRDSPRATLAEGLLPWGGTAYTRSATGLRAEGGTGAWDGTAAAAAASASASEDWAGEGSGFGAGSGAAFGAGFGFGSGPGGGGEGAGSGSDAGGAERAASGAGAESPGGSSGGAEAWAAPGAGAGPGARIDTGAGAEAWPGSGADDRARAPAGAEPWEGPGFGDRSGEGPGLGIAAGVGAGAAGPAEAGVRSVGRTRSARRAGAGAAAGGEGEASTSGAKWSSSRRLALTSVALGVALAPLLAFLVFSGSVGSSSDDEAGSGGTPAAPPSGAATPTVPPSPTPSPTPSETASPSKPPRKEEPPKSPSPSTPGPPKPSLPYGPPLNGAYTQVVNVGSGLCLDIRGELEKGTDVVTATCSSRATQRWRVDSHGDALQSFADPDLCLDSRGATDDGVGIWDCDSLDGDNGDNLRFDVDSRGMIRPAVAPGYAVTPDALGSVAFAEASGRDGQRWRAGAGPVHD